MTDREVLSQLNKRALSDLTGIPHDRLRKYSCGNLKALSSEERNSIYELLAKMAKIFKEEN